MSELTENEIINALKHGGTWNGSASYGQLLNITYSFPSTAQDYYANTLAFLGVTTVAGYFKYSNAILATPDTPYALTSPQKNAVKNAMDEWTASSPYGMQWNTGETRHNDTFPAFRFAPYGLLTELAN